MNHRRMLYPATCLSMIAVCLWKSDARAQVNPNASLQTLQAPDDVSVSLWASEPMVNNPTAMEVDSRGRVWIAEGMNYRMKMKTFPDLQRVAGADRIRILEDTNGDGQADKVTDFAGDIFPVPLGMAIEEIWNDGVQTGTRVYVGNSPDLLVLEDTDGDDIADQRFSLLTGFRGVDSDHGLHGTTFGPDGRLYFTVGDARYGADQVQSREPTFDVTDQSGRRLSANNFGTTLRVDRDGTQLEVLSSGHRNNYEAAVDSFGHVFGSDNDDDGNRGCRMYWVLDGGEYGYQHPQSSRHWAEELPGIIPKLVGTGNGAPGGIIVYEGGSLPPRYRGSILQIDSGTRQLNVFPLERYGAGFRGDYQVLLRGDDDWFRPVDVAVAPDGSVFVCDWYDAGVGGNRFSDQTTGRIYRLSGDVQTEAVRMDPSRPVDGLRSPNAATRLAARDLLVASGAASREVLLTMFESESPLLRARALHVLFALPESGRTDALAALNDREPRIRELALHLLTGDSSTHWLAEADDQSPIAAPAIEVLDLILPLSADDDAGVRRALMMALRRVPTELIEPPLRQLIGGWDGSDRYYLEALRAMLVDRDGAFLSSVFAELANQAIQTGWDASPIAEPPYYPIGSNDAYLKIGDVLPTSNAASRLIGLAWALRRTESLPALGRILAENRSPSVERIAVKALAQITDPAAGNLLVQRFQSSDVHPETRSMMLQVLAQKVNGDWQALRSQAAFSEATEAALKDPVLILDAMKLIGRVGLQDYAETLVALADNEHADGSHRAAAVVTLGQLRHTPVQQIATSWLKLTATDSDTGRLQVAALDALASLSGGDRLIDYVTDQRIPLAVRRHAMQRSAATPTGASQLINQLKSGDLSEELAGELMFLLRNHSDRQVQRLAQRELPDSTADTGRVFDASLFLTIQGDSKRGQDIFENHTQAACARCHRTTGEGNLVGPNLASIGMKYGASELLYHIQYPSAAINYNFVTSLFLMTDGRILTGLVLKRGPGEIRLGLATGEQIKLDPSDIEEERTQPTSLMPDGLIATFTDQQVADLLEYLITLRQGDVGVAVK